MLWAYFRRNHAWYFMRNVLIVAGFIGLIGYVAFPTAPPRMFPELGFVDTLNGEAVSHQTGIVETFANPYAAMPSLHTAYALIIGTSGFLVCRHLLLKIMWACYPALVVFSIVATANHWFLDAIAGAFVALRRGDDRPRADPRRRAQARPRAGRPAGPRARASAPRPAAPPGAGVGRLAPALRQPALQERPLRLVLGQRERLAVRGGRLVQPAEPPQQVGLRARQVAVARQLAAAPPAPRPRPGRPRGPRPPRGRWRG